MSNRSPNIVRAVAAALALHDKTYPGADAYQVEAQQFDHVLHYIVIVNADHFSVPLVYRVDEQGRATRIRARKSRGSK